MRRCYQNVKWWQFYRRFFNWNLLRKIHEACDESRHRVSLMSDEERAELLKRAHELIFPNGYWTCYCGLLKCGHLVENGKQCHFSEYRSLESDPSLEKPGLNTLRQFHNALESCLSPEPENTNACVEKNKEQSVDIKEA